MLRSVGYECLLPSTALKNELRQLGCDTVLDVDGLVRGMGYDPPMRLPEAPPDLMRRADLYVDVKAHRNGPKVWGRWPNLEKRTLWYRINGGQPEHVINARGDHGDELNPPCPVLTPNQWYSPLIAEIHGICNPIGKAYSCWPPFYRFDEYFAKHGRPFSGYDSAMCLIHNLSGWGYGALVDNIKKLRVKCYGAGSPDGLIPHSHIPDRLARSVAMVHLKSSDAPGYAIYECLAAACPLICTRRLIWRCRMGELLVPGETCLVFDRETHDGLTEEDVRTCTEEVSKHLDVLRDPETNRRIGMAGHERLKNIMWSEQKHSDVASLREFMQRNFS